MRIPPINGYKTLALASILTIHSTCEEIQPPQRALSPKRSNYSEPHRSSSCESQPAPRWVLRDKDGNRVKALVEPRCGIVPGAQAIERCISLDFASANSFPCVRIIDHSGLFINLQYDLMSGRLEPCKSWDFADIDMGLPFIYLNKDCEGDPWWSTEADGPGAPEFTTARDVFLGGGDLWYSAEPKCVRDVVRWSIDPTTKECMGPYDSSGLICPLRRVPDWVKNLLPNPPYTMAVEYE